MNVLGGEGVEEGTAVEWPKPDDEGGRGRDDHESKNERLRDSNQGNKS